MLRQILATVTVLSCVGLVGLAAQDAGPSREGAIAAFKRALIEAMARNDRNAVARMVKYPATALIGGFNVPLLDRATVLQTYQIVFTPELRCLVEKSGVMTDVSGGMLAAGRVRVLQDGNAFKIARINVPPADGSAPPPSKTIQAYFRKGQAQFAGRLYGDGLDAYLVAGRKGAHLEARIERFQGRGAMVRVIDTLTGQSLERPGAQAPRTWAGRFTEPGSYRVEVVRLAPYCDPPFTYLLTLTLR